MQDAGLFYGHVAVRPDAGVESAESLFLEEIERVREEPVSEAELAKAKRKLEVRLVEELRTAHSLASRIGRDYVAFGRIRPLEELLGGIRAVSAEDLQRVARTYLDPTKRSIVRVVPSP
jgi:zinc protease